MNALVLVVEDDTLLRQTIADVLEIEGYEVECARNGREALALLQNATQPCLIVLDLTMPEMDGWEFRRRQKANTALASIPVLVISGPSNLSPQGEIPDADDYLVKPFSVVDLVMTVDRLCETDVYSHGQTPA